MIRSGKKPAGKWKRILNFSVVGTLLLLFSWFQFAYWTSTNGCGRSIPPSAERMKAIRYCKHGSANDVLKLEEVERPLPNGNQILVRVCATNRFYSAAEIQTYETYL